MNRALLAVAVLFTWASPIGAQEPDTAAVSDSVTVRFTDAELRVVVQALGRYLGRPVLVGTVPGIRITFESPTPVPRSAVRSILEGLVRTHGLEFEVDSAFYRITQAESEARGREARSRGGGDQRPPELFVLRLRHARAADVAGTIGQLFGVGAGGGARGLSSGTLSEELRRNVAPAPRAEPGERQDGRTGDGAATLAGPVTIVADELTNSLLIRASEDDFEVISQAVEQLDLRPLQVLIQVLIVEARRDRLFALGVEGQTGDIDLEGTAVGRASFRPGGGLGQLVLEIMKLGTFDIEGMLRLAVAKGDVRIISRPVLLASNNREARILVGSQRPFVQVSRSLPTDTPQRDQVVQYKDVGTALTVLPTINTDGYVALLIRQEVNSATNETQFDAPIISTREAETEVLVKDGQTIVLGGLRDRQHEVTKSGIPILSDIPILGGLFGSQERRTTETELFLFITPIILRDDAEVDAATADAAEQARKAGARLPTEREP